MTYSADDGRAELIPPSKPHATYTADPDLTLMRSIGDMTETMQTQAERLAQHEGRLEGHTTAIGAVQASHESWKAVAIGVAALLLGVVAIHLTVGIFWQQANAERFDDLAERVDVVDERVEDLATAIETLPARLSDQILNAAAQMATIVGQPQVVPIIVQQPAPIPAP